MQPALASLAFTAATVLSPISAKWLSRLAASPCPSSHIAAKAPAADDMLVAPMARQADALYWLSIADSNLWFWAGAIAAERRLNVAVSEPDQWPSRARRRPTSSRMYAATG
jgi:hypothetical protein